MIKRLIKKLKTLRLYFVSKRCVKSLDEMDLFEQWQYARDDFQHYAIRYIYDSGDGFRRTVSSEEKQRYASMKRLLTKFKLKNRI